MTAGGDRSDATTYLHGDYPPTAMPRTKTIARHDPAVSTLLGSAHHIPCGTASQRTISDARPNE